MFLLFSFTNGYSQFFVGELTYNFNCNDTIQMQYLTSLGISVESDFLATYEKLYISRDTLLSEKFNITGLPLFKGMRQIGNSAVIYDYNSGDDIDINYYNLNNFQYDFVEKTQDTLWILNTLCHKYIYSQNEPKNSGETIVHAWIPDGYKFIDSYKNGGFFNLFFFKHGLAFRKELLYKNTKRSWELTQLIYKNAPIILIRE
jgi:hypothetical protein